MPNLPEYDLNQAQVLQINKKLFTEVKNKNEAMITKETYSHFRKYFKSDHPALITNKYSDTKYEYRKVSNSKKDGTKNNGEEIFPNPNPRDKAPMFIGKRVRYDKIKNFSLWKFPWKFPKK